MTDPTQNQPDAVRPTPSPPTRSRQSGSNPSRTDASTLASTPASTTGSTTGAVAPRSGVGVVPTSQRRPGPDVVRALAILGVIVMNYHGYMFGRGGRIDGGGLYDFFNPWFGPLSTRFAATFVLTAGVGVTLLTRRAVATADVAAMRWRLVRRGLLLYGFGMVFDFVWEGTILPYYGAMFTLAALLFTLPSVVVTIVGLAAALTGWITNWWITDQQLAGHDMTWFLDPGRRSPRGLLINVFFNGTHPLFPWLAFFCAGIVVGRLLISPVNWRPAAAIGGGAAFVIATLINSVERTGIAAVVWSDNPFDRGIVYVASALGTALLAFTAISYLADRYADQPVVDLLRRAGQMSLTIYLAHALLFNLIVDWLGLVKPAGLGTDLTFALVVWAVSLSLAAAYQRRFGRGPAETVYRRLTA